MLLNMYKEQLRCEKEPRFAHPDAAHSGPDTMLSPSSVNSQVTTLHMTKCIAIVIELPYVDFVREYLMQVRFIFITIFNCFYHCFYYMLLFILLEAYCNVDLSCIFISAFQKHNVS